MKKSKNTSDVVYKILAKNYMKWTRINTNHIQVLTLGYCGAECMMMENELKREGMYAISRNYDKSLKKTVTVYKMVD